jgi:hypothetical protein
LNKSTTHGGRKLTKHKRDFSWCRNREMNEKSPELRREGNRSTNHRDHSKTHREQKANMLCQGTVSTISFEMGLTSAE